MPSSQILFIKKFFIHLLLIPSFVEISIFLREVFPFHFFPCYFFYSYIYLSVIIPHSIRSSFSFHSFWFSLVCPFQILLPPPPPSSVKHFLCIYLTDKIQILNITQKLIKTFSFFSFWCFLLFSIASPVLSQIPKISFSVCYYDLMVWTVHEDTYLYIFPINKDKNPVLNYQFRWEVNQKMR